MSNTTSFNTEQKWVLVIVLLSYLMILLDISIVITGLPEIRSSLHFSTEDLSWVQNAYTLSLGGCLLLGARAGDLFGRKRMYLLGLSIFTLTSLAIASAQNAPWLLAARALQGLGAAILTPTTLALLSDYFPAGEQRTKALAYYAATAGIGASLGLVLGGLFAGWLSWRVGFVMNVPVGIGLWLLAQRVLTEARTQPGRLDLPGALTSVLGMTALVYGIVSAASHGWQDLQTQLSIGTGVLLLIVFTGLEAHVAQPLLPLRLLIHRERATAYVSRMLFLGAMVSFFFFATQFLQNILHFTPLQAGLAFLPMTIPTFIASLFVPRLSQYLGNHGLLLLALGCGGVGMFGLSQVTAHTAFTTGIALPMLLIGLGNGAALAPLTISGVADVKPQDMGAASGLVNVAHQLGSTLGLSLLIVLFAAAKTSDLSGNNLLAHQLAVGFAGCTLMLGTALLITLLFQIIPTHSLVKCKVTANYP